jgi:hypothetical protein
MQRHRPRPPAQPLPEDRYTGTWLDSLPVPEAREGGESTWELWHEASRQLDAAFAPTEPSDLAPLPLGTSSRADAVAPAAAAAPLSVAGLMLVARRHNRVCPHPPHWIRLYQALEGSEYVDLPPPPVERWIWSKLSDLQKRLCLRDYFEWAERHDRLPQVAQFLDGLAEADWLHMGEA